MANKYQIGIIGAGMWGKTHISMLQIEGRAAVTWVCDVNQAAAQTAADKFGVERVTQNYQDLLNDPALDAIVVASPP